ncbi:hypothetical protein [Flavobacterium sp. ABG]|uniref:hypothetical protein n=1 Tax=Flavobacterium sp. ABG TaxID=1423322 RepID=UPI00064A78BC|nr:hypothetical protein [Flavobacterium sp. ABG]KLT67797.1 hypothetical protein AB674_20855 [Flavobacterium sp. ABG]
MSAQSHFFVESGGFTQSQQQAFGPLSSSKFNLTSQFTLNAPKKAYSICKGVVLIQPQINPETGAATDKVNLVLRPYKQPFPGLNVKYFVYRGLQRADFFTTDSEPKIIPHNKAVNSDFITKINEDFIAFHEGRVEKIGDTTTPIPPPAFLAKHIGFDSAIPDSTLLSSLFFKESEFKDINGNLTEKNNFELPLIDIGKSLGNFASGECGIDVVLNYGDYQHNFDNGEFVFDLGYARKPFATITVTGTTPYKQKLEREQSTQFIDIAAFYGLFVPEDTVNIVSAGTQTSKKGTEIYNSIISNFYTKNNWYVYIQSDRTRSYDFYENYKIKEGTGNLKSGLLADPTTKIVPMTESTYGTFDWPVLINDQTQANTVATNSLYFQLSTDNNNNATFYGQIAKVANAQKDNFINVDGLRLPPDEEGNYGDLTSTIQLTTPAVQGKNIAALNILLYHGKVSLYTAGTTQDENGDPVILYGQTNFFDDVFSLIHSEPLLTLSGDKSYSRMTSEKLNIVNAFYDKKQQGISIVQTLTVNDVIETGITEKPVVERVTYLTEAGDVMNNAISATGSTTPDTKTTASASGTVTKTKTYELPEPYYYDLKLFTDSTQTITGLQLKTLDGSTPNKIILGLTQDENNSIKTLITGDKKNPRLFLIDLFADGNELVSPENIKYQKYKVAIVAENTEGKNELSEPESPVFVYSLDRYYHFSKGYSEYMPEQELESTYLIINKEIE